jgi:MFS transporter, MFS domain-containing protein family, molybdate-anion transporter
MAILAGIVAQVLEDHLGHIGPFQGAIALTTLALFLVLGWEENYGEEEEGSRDDSSLYKQFIDGWTTTVTDSRIWRIGMTQALSEGAMYTVSGFQGSNITVWFMLGIFDNWLTVSILCHV